MAWHYPWETKVNIKSAAEQLQKAAKLLDSYSTYSPYVAVFFGDKSRVKLVHEKILNLAKFINAGGTYYGWAQEIKELCEAIQVLNKIETMNSQIATAGAFGQMLIACSSIAEKIPFGGFAYGGALKAFGMNFEKIYKSLLPAGFTDEQYQQIWKNPQDQRGNG